ncbi:DUF4276 family protein [Streptomyces sp. GMY01]|uniref:DUF4276 family protein n=1 Tax=Streptomyces sp. GMY02 TaxID=1333528 RepID=UPI00146C6B4F|nr:DUF4276 family protein [Streptomyces sp. GMY02]NMO35326.1 DUF4276 family protein [Streptomyces sp. GMY02]
MTLRILFTGEGTSDDGLVPHIETVAAVGGTPVTVTAPDFGRLGSTHCHSVPEKLRVARRLGDDYDLIIIHRDADKFPAEDRRAEIAKAVAAEWPAHPHIAVVPVRMLEAWLLLDEMSIRQVAENPNGRMKLALPKGTAVEGIKDPKKLLKDTLAIASGYTGRRLDGFQKRFPHHRHKLLERLDPYGPVSDLPSWRAFMDDLETALLAAR